MGLRYTNYHTAPICSASRAALLMGRNPHSIHVGGHVAVPLPVASSDGKIPPAAGTVAANLRKAGYHLNHDLADQAIAMIGSRSAQEPAPPFFLYFATGTAHAPIMPRKNG